MSCIEKKRKPMVPLKTLDVVFRRRYVPNTQYYFANRQYALLKGEKKLKPTRSFRVPRSDKLLSYIKYSDRKEKLEAKDRLRKPLHLKDNLRVSATRDLSKRLFIDEPPDDVRAVVEIHPEFYTVIEGRPLRCFDDIKVYLNNIRNYAMNRQQIGYRRDLILKIEEGLVDGIEEHDKINRNLKQHVSNFQRFLTEDYKKACLKISKSEKVYSDLVGKNTDLLGYVSKLTIINNVIFKLDSIRSILKIYRRYLIFVAPLSWRQRHDETLIDKMRSTQFETGHFATDNDLVETLDIDKIIELAKLEFKKPLPALMYFEHPQQMMYLFRTMELQSREYLIQLSKTDVPFRLLQERIKQLKQETKQELDHFLYYIDRINHEIERENFNEAYLQNKFLRILETSFYNNIAKPTTLKLKICIEYVYEQVFGKSEEGHQNLHDPMKVLEVMYEDYNLRLDSLDFNIVNQARNDFFAQDLKMMRNACIAQRELKSFKEMTSAMNKAFLNPKTFTRPVLTKFHGKKRKGQVKQITEADGFDKLPSKKYKLTSEEKEGLLMFTDWCEGTNPTPYLKDYYEFVVPTLTFRDTAERQSWQ